MICSYTPESTTWLGAYELGTATHPASYAPFSYIFLKLHWSTRLILKARPTLLFHIHFCSLGDIETDCINFGQHWKPAGWDSWNHWGFGLPRDFGMARSSRSLCQMWSQVVFKPHQKSCLLDTTKKIPNLLRRSLFLCHISLLFKCTGSAARPLIYACFFAVLLPICPDMWDFFFFFFL